MNPEEPSGRKACNQGSIRHNQRVIVYARRAGQNGTVTRKNNSQSVVIIDDDRSVQSALKDLMESAGLSARCFGSAEEFLESKHRKQTAVLITDIRMPGMSGLELQAMLNAEASRIPIIFITAHADAKMKIQAVKAGAIDFLPKPFDDESLLANVRIALNC
jgi:FixJ family two-component response regulator